MIIIHSVPTETLLHVLLEYWYLRSDKLFLVFPWNCIFLNTWTGSAECFAGCHSALHCSSRAPYRFPSLSSPSPSLLVCTLLFSAHSLASLTWRTLSSISSLPSLLLSIRHAISHVISILFLSPSSCRTFSSLWPRLRAIFVTNLPTSTTNRALTIDWLWARAGPLK